MLAVLQISFAFGPLTHSLEVDKWNGFSSQTMNGAFTSSSEMPTTVNITAWPILGRLEIVEVLRDYITLNPQEDQT